MARLNKGNLANTVLVENCDGDILLVFNSMKEVKEWVRKHPREIEKLSLQWGPLHVLVIKDHYIIEPE